MPSRRSYIAALALGMGLAGCSAPSDSGPTSETPTDDPTDSPTDEPSPSPSPTTRPPDTQTTGVESLPVDDAAVDWAVRADQGVVHHPRVVPDLGRLYVVTGRPQVGTPTDGSPSESALLSLSTDDGSVGWRRTTARPAGGPPVVHDRRVHVPVGYSSGYDGRNQSIVAYDHGGEGLWSTPSRDAWLTVVGAADGSLFVATGDDALSRGGEELFAVDDTGAVDWEVETGDPRGGRVVGDTLLYRPPLDTLDGYATSDGERRWRVREQPLLDATGAIAALRTRDRSLTFTTPGDGTPLVARSVVDGTEQWRYGPSGFVPTGLADASEVFAPIDRPPAVVVTGEDGTVAALRADGTVDWTFEVDAAPAGTPAAGSDVYVADDAGTVYALDADGREQWRASLSELPGLYPLADGVLAVTGPLGDRVFVSLRADGTERWRYRATLDVTHPAIAGNRVFLGREDGAVLALSGE